MSGEEKSLSTDDLEHESNSSEKSKIDIVEIIIIVLISITSELLEWGGDAANILPVVGQAIWLFTYAGGLVVSAILFIWAFLRGMFDDQVVAIKLILMIGGPAADIFTGGLFPETLTLVAAIFIHNHFKGKNIKHIAKVLKGHL